MKKITLTLIIAPLMLSACQDFALNQRQMDSELRYICSTAINTRIGSIEYSNCRRFYDKVLLQYDINVSRPWSFDVSTVMNRSRPLADRCRSYSPNPAVIWNCLQEQESIMLAEHVRKKHLREEQEAKKELIREKEHERAHHEKELIKEREKQKTHYSSKQQPDRQDKHHSVRKNNDDHIHTDNRDERKDNSHTQKNEKPNMNEDFNKKSHDRH